MTDRDRLAADLHAAHLGCRLDYRGDVDCGGGAWPCHTDQADRLITLGWARLEADRLERAIVAAHPDGAADHPGPGCAHAIAKAYREDTDDRP